MSSARAFVLLLSMLLRGLLARDRKRLGPTQSLRALPPAALVPRALPALHLLSQDRCVVACLHLQRRTMLFLVPTTRSHHSSRLKQLTRNHSRLCTSSRNNSHPSLPVSRIPTTGLTLAVYLPHLPHHLLALVVRQVKRPHKVLFLHTVPVLAALPPKCALLWRIEQHPHVTVTRALTSITLTLLLAVVSLVVLLHQHRLKLLLSKLPAIVTSALQLLRQRDIANGRRTTTLAPSHLRMMKSAKRLKSLTAVGPHPHTACPRLKCHARAHRMALTPGGSTTAIIHLRLPITHLRYPR